MINLNMFKLGLEVLIQELALLAMPIFSADY
jgi:hypothetical protein